MALILCADCGLILKATDGPCRNCGSNNRSIFSIDSATGKEAVNRIIATLEKSTEVDKEYTEEKREYIKQVIAILKQAIED